MSVIALAAANLLILSSLSHAALTITETWENDPGDTVKGVWSSVESYYVGLFANSYDGQTWVVDLDWKNLSGGIAEGGPLGGWSLGSDLKNYSGAQVDKIQDAAYYVSTLSNQLASQTVVSGATMQIAFGSNVDWDYSTSSTASGKENFYTTAIHEIAHGLGFISNDKSSGGWASPGPGIFDFYLGLGTTGTQSLVGMSDSELASAFVSENVYWTGTQGNTGNDGNPIKIYAPSPYEDGSSMSHIDPSVDSTRSLIMYPADSGQPAYYSYTPMEIGMFADMGYTVVPEPTSFVLLLSALAVFVLLATKKQLAASPVKHPEVR